MRNIFRILLSLGYFFIGVALAQQDGATFLQRGIDMAVEGQSEKAREAFDAAIEAATRDRDDDLLARAQLNAGRLAWRLQQAQRAREFVTAGLAAIEKLPDTPGKVLLLLNAARTMRVEPDTRNARPWDRKLTHDALFAARQIARIINDSRGMSYANGYLAELYTNERRYGEALELLDVAIFGAQDIDAPELLYQWYWQRGRVLANQNKLDAAAPAYRQAVFHLNEVRDALKLNTAGGASTFRTVLGPLYREYADTVLQLSADDVEPHVLLNEAMAAIEQFKSAELQDYFLDECVVLAQERAKAVSAVAGDTVVVYPVLLDQRLDLIVSAGDDVQRVTVEVPRNDLEKQVRLLRRALERRGSQEYRAPAQALHDWLIAPIEPFLRQAGARTLVIVPDGVLRTIPMSVLHDGKRFLIERYAVATTPGLTLTEAQPLGASSRVLVAGLSESVDAEFSPLPAVDVELDALTELLGVERAYVLRNEQFTSGGVESALAKAPYNVVHIASHGRFTSDAEESFILAYDGRITMDQLETYMQIGRFSDPVELLTLSACETAVGDDRAALGLSGIAIKAGARSALGSLWQVSDAATAQLITAFYRRLFEHGMSRAAALQAAQLELLDDKLYAHPVFWSPFLLIGSWL